MTRPPARTRAVLAGALLAAGLVGGAGPARIAGLPGFAGRALAAQPELEHLVVLLRPSGFDELTREALAHITGELAAARFRVVIVPLEPGVDARGQVDTVGGDLDAVAAFALVRDAGGAAGSIELWISDRLAHRTTIQQMHIQDGDTSRAARLLAVESVELIRISLADLWPRPQPRPPPAPPPVSEPPPQGRVTLSLGIGMIEDFGASVRLWSPVVRAGYRWPGGLGLFAAARGFGSDVDLAETDGTARVGRDAGWLGVSYTFRVGRRIQPVVMAGSGLERLHAEGSSATMAPAHTLTSWFGLGALGAGVSATLVPHLALVLDVEGMLVLPPAVVRIGSVDAARFDRPSLLVDGGVRASF
jgi:hypothetical protein